VWLTGSLASEEETCDRLPLSLWLLENHRGGVCPCCFFGNPAGESGPVTLCPRTPDLRVEAAADRTVVLWPLVRAPQLVHGAATGSWALACHAQPVSLIRWAEKHGEGARASKDPA
jgi:hypothetical protein